MNRLRLTVEQSHAQSPKSCNPCVKDRDSEIRYWRRLINMPTKEYIMEKPLTSMKRNFERKIPYFREFNKAAESEYSEKNLRCYSATPQPKMQLLDYSERASFCETKKRTILSDSERRANYNYRYVEELQLKKEEEIRLFQEQNVRAMKQYQEQRYFRRISAINEEVGKLMN